LAKALVGEIPFNKQSLVKLAFNMPLPEFVE